MTIPVWESPSDYDRRKVALLDFAPTCEIEDCANRAARGIQCAACGVVHTWVCTPHGEGIPERMTQDKVCCLECKAEGAPAEVVKVISLARWF